MCPWNSAVSIGAQKQAPKVNNSSHRSQCEKPLFVIPLGTSHCRGNPTFARTVAVSTDFAISPGSTSFAWLK
jgi:hypothetical protein